MTTENNVPQIYQCLADVTREIVDAGGVSKARRNEQQRYSFRGVEDFLNALAPLLPKHHIVIVPRVAHHELIERQTAGPQPKAFYHAIAQYDFTFYCTLDGSSVTAEGIVGEAIDYADKSFNKTISMAYKYACMMTFCIPTEVEDADETTPAPAQARQTQPTPAQLAELERSAEAVGKQMAEERAARKPIVNPHPPTFEGIPTNGNGRHTQEDFVALVKSSKIKNAGDIVKAHTANGTTDWNAAFAELETHVKALA